MLKKQKNKTTTKITDLLNEEKREEMIKQFMPLVRRVVHRISSRLPHDVNIDEMLNSGMIGLVDAFEKYDHKHETNFSTYAQFRVRGAILDSFRDQDWAPRSLRHKANKLDSVVSRLEQELGRPANDQEIAKELGLNEATVRHMLNEINNVSLVSFEDLGFGHGEEHFSNKTTNDNLNSLTDYVGPLSGLLESERTQLVGQAIDKLAEKEKLVICLYFYEELNLKEIGEVIGVTESRASQIRSRALARLKHNLTRHNSTNELI
ncbi:MAG: RNA polymerase sigma factor FliA [Deltaproteobacteria bacterium]|jgi:RNA polymerase sigma factor for flagellar operon FliA|nr:RNA polymerase sigma factor FliA [Deltaproteobacteria bacterium]